MSPAPAFSARVAAISLRWLFALALLGAVTALSAVLWRLSAGRPRPTLTLYCAAGLQAPIDQIIERYRRETGVSVQVQYRGTGELLSSLSVVRRGDLFLAADESYVREARAMGLCAEALPVASMRPVIALRKNDARPVGSIADLLAPDLRLAMANPQQAAIGKSVRGILRRTGQWDALAARVKVYKPTVNDVANDIKIGAVDAGIVWDATVQQYPELRAVRLPAFDAAVERVTLGVLTYSQSPTEALRFGRYLSARDRGLEEFGRHGYQVVEGDAWAHTPQIVLFSGGVNRPAIEQTIRLFEQREGVRITRVFNGCGVLVTQMKAGQKPDGYLACDRTFVPPVADLFDEPIDVSETEIVLAVPKGSDKPIAALEDLRRPGLRIGLGHPEASTLGALTRRLLEARGLYEDIRRNVKSEQATADVLVQQLVLGTLDAVLVYEANCSQVMDKIRMTRLAIPDAIAVQPFAVGRQSQYKGLVLRLQEQLTSADSRQRYEAAGFRWRAATGPATRPEARN